MNKWISRAWKENRTFLVFIILMFAFRSSFADWNTVPTGSMKPTILEGDRILVNKIAYDFRVPFTYISLFEVSDPERGDIVVFESEVSDIRLVKRVIGVPGDVVELKNNVLYLNDEVLMYSDVSSASNTIDRTEALGSTPYRIRINKYDSWMATFGPVKVPDNHYLVLGDNRDNSSDSRVIGFVPRDEIVGRSRTVVMSLNYDNFYIPRADRFFHTL